MLKDFFKLDKPFDVLKTEGDLEKRLEKSRLKNFLYSPNSVSSLTSKKFRNKQFKNVSFSKTEFSEMTFNNCLFEDCLFIGTKFKDCEFHQCSFQNCNTHKITFRGCYIDPDSLKIDKAFRLTSANIGLQLFQQLYRNSKDIHQEGFATEAYYRFRKWKMRQRYFDKEKGHITKKDFFIAASLDWISFLSTGFGLRLGRFLWAITLFLLVSSWFVHVNWVDLGLVNGEGNIASGSFLSSFYYTVVVITTLGFGDITPTTDFGRIVAVVLSLSGIGLLGTFVGMIIRKVVR